MSALLSRWLPELRTLIFDLKGYEKHYRTDGFPIFCFLLVQDLSIKQEQISSGCSRLLLSEYRLA